MHQLQQAPGFSPADRIYVKAGHLRRDPGAGKLRCESGIQANSAISLSFSAKQTNIECYFTEFYWFIDVPHIY
jgi:hypothetical protein